MPLVLVLVLVRACVPQHATLSVFSGGALI